MNLQSEIQPELWECIARSYESELYKSAILDAMHYLSDVLRDRADVDGDGEALAGKALGGVPPRLYINQLQTASDRDEQRGFEAIIRGLYTGIRNPRSHERIEDVRETADAVIHFVSFLLTVLNKSQAGFSLDSWVSSVFDPDFVHTVEYAQTLISEVPPKKRLETALALYDRRTDQYVKALELVLPELLETVNPEQRKIFLARMSQDLKTLRDKTVSTDYYDDEGFPYTKEYCYPAEPKIRLIIRLLPKQYWPDLDYAARLRIENKLIESIKGGEYDPLKGSCSSGAFGTWSRGLVEHFDPNSKRKLGYVMIEKLRQSMEERAYLRAFLLGEVVHILPIAREPQVAMSTFVKSICTGIIEDANVEPYATNPLTLVNSLPAVLRSSVTEKIKEQAPDLYEQLFGHDEDIPF